MKKLITLFLLFFASCTFCLAGTYPRWQSMPLNVYIPQYGQISVMMKQAFTAWEQKSNGLVSFKFVGSPIGADIQVDFPDFVSHCSSERAVGCAQTQVRGRSYTKAYLRIGIKDYKIDHNGVMQKVTRPKENLYGVMLHEIGHSIGLDHSSSPKSIMYDTDLPTLQYLTPLDMELIRLKYND